MAAVAGLALLAAAPAQAQSGTSAVCTATFPEVSISPPFKPFVLTRASGTVTSGGQTGRVICVGEIGGARVTGAGTGGIMYAYSSGTCAAHVGLGTATWTIPTEAGPKQLTGTLSVRRIALGVLAEVRFPDALADLAGAVVPVAGDCVITPLSKVHVTVAGPLVGP
ncbi:MAG: hypothetical protein M3401_19015 [Actinomycetota bacterium]|nr:hypothetical protein [Actinomycetota bacterium]